MRKTIGILGLLPLVAAWGCDNPADDVAAATVHESETPAAEGETQAEEGDEREEAETPAALERLAINGETSSIGFTGSKVTGSHDGGFREFTGQIGLDPADPTKTSIEVTIQTASLFADDPRLTNHLKSDEFFDVENIPTATFRSTSIVAGGSGDATHTITGELALHGVTRTISFPATVAVADAQVTATAEFAINRQQFNITYPGMPDDLIRDEVVIRLDIRADRSAS